MPDLRLNPERVAIGDQEIGYLAFSDRTDPVGDSRSLRRVDADGLQGFFAGQALGYGGCRQFLRKVTQPAVEQQVACGSMFERRRSGTGWQSTIIPAAGRERLPLGRVHLWPGRIHASAAEDGGRPIALHRRNAPLDDFPGSV